MDRLARQSSSTGEAIEGEYERRKKTAEETEEKDIDVARVSKEWERATKKFDNIHLRLRLEEDQALLQALRDEKKFSSAPHPLDLHELDLIVRRMKVSEIFAQRAAAYLRQSYVGHHCGFWGRALSYGAAIGVSGATIGLLFSNMISTLIHELFYTDPVVNGSEFANFSMIIGNLTTAMGREVTPDTIGPILRVSMNILAFGFERLKEHVDVWCDEYDAKLLKLDNILGPDGGAGDLESTAKIAECESKLAFWRAKLVDHSSRRRIRVRAIDQGGLEKRIEVAKRRLLRWDDTDSAGVSRDVWRAANEDGEQEGGELLKPAVRMVKKKKPKCARAFRTTFSKRRIPIKRLLAYKRAFLDVRGVMASVLQSGLAKIECKNKSLRAELDVLDELEQKLVRMFAKLDAVPDIDSDEEAQVKKMERGVKIPAGVLALAIVGFDQYNEFEGEPMLGLVITAFFVYLFVFTLSRLSEAVSIRRARIGVEKSQSKHLQARRGYIDEVHAIKQFFLIQQAKMQDKSPITPEEEKKQAKILRRFRRKVSPIMTLASMSGGRSSLVKRMSDITVSPSGSSSSTSSDSSKRCRCSYCCMPCGISAYKDEEKDYRDEEDCYEEVVDGDMFSMPTAASSQHLSCIVSAQSPEMDRDGFDPTLEDAYHSTGGVNELDEVQREIDEQEKQDYKRMMIQSRQQQRMQMQKSQLRHPLSEYKCDVMMDTITKQLDALPQRTVELSEVVVGARSAANTDSDSSSAIRRNMSRLSRDLQQTVQRLRQDAAAAAKTPKRKSLSVDSLKWGKVSAECRQLRVPTSLFGDGFDMLDIYEEDSSDDGGEEEEIHLSEMPERAGGNKDTRGGEDDNK